MTFRKKILGLIFLIISATLVYLNIRLSFENYTKDETKQDLIFQLNFLEKELKINNLGEKMQDIFPEGFIFTNALYGLSWCEIGINESNPTIKKRAIDEALFAYNQINSPIGKSTFGQGMVPDYGIYYAGWNNYLLSKILLLDSNFVNYNRFKNIYKLQCELIIEAIENSNSPFLESYGGESWPADMSVAMASISNYKIIFDNKYEKLVLDWIINVRTKLDQKTKLIPHKVKYNNGATIEGARGSSSGLTIRLLAEIDPVFASEQFKLYNENFVETTFGLPSVREYPKGQTGNGDIDSGPVIFEVGFASTIFSICTFSVMNDNKAATNQFKTINAFGFGYISENTKKYVFGQLPIADAFIAWGRSSGLNTNLNNEDISLFIPLKFHLISILTIAFMWVVFYWKTFTKSLKKIKTN